MAVVRIAEGLEPSLPVPLHDEDDLKLLRTADVVRLTKLSRTTVYRLIAGGVLPSIRQGRTVRVPLLGLRRWIAESSSAQAHASHVV